MKWVAVLAFVIVLSLTESRNLQKRDHHGGHHDHDHDHKVLLIGTAWNMLGKEDFEGVAMVLFSQNLQKCPFEEHVQRVINVAAIGEKCSTGIRTAQCGKSVTTVVLDEMCKTPENAEKYPFHAGCCAKEDPDRHQCFVEHKLTDSDALPPFKKSAPEQMCKDYHDNRASFLGHYIYEVARRNSLIYPPAILAVAHSFEHITTDCCKDATTSAQCFTEKKPALIREIKMANSIQQHNCYILKNFHEKTLKLTKLVQTAQRFPKASYDTVQDIVHDLVHLTKTCCSGDMMACMADRLALTTKTCAKKDDLSSKLAACCEKRIIERSGCIAKMDNDDRPADLSAQVREYIEDVAMCKRFEDESDGLIEHFIYDYARRHPEMSIQMLLKIGYGYTALLTKCCAGEDKLACLAQGEVEMKKEVQASVELLKTNCGALEKLGSYHYQNLLLGKYTRKMPQAKTSTLIHLTDEMTHVGEYCCKVPAEKQIPCSEGTLALIIGDMCHKQEGHFVNNQVSHCCSDCYASQRSCFTAMGPDASYVPPAPSADYFKFNDELCAAADPTALEVKKQTFLVDLIKLKQDIEEEQLKEISAAFLGMLEQCCKADNHEECFAKEGPKLITKCKEILGLQAAA